MKKSEDTKKFPEVKLDTVELESEKAIGEIVVEDVFKIGDTSEVNKTVSTEVSKTDVVGIIASLVGEANLREGDVLSVESSNALSASQRSRSPFSAVSDTSNSGTSSLVMSPKGPFRSCMNRGIGPSKSKDNTEPLDDNVEKNKKSLSDVLNQTKDKNNRDFADLAGSMTEASGQRIIDTTPKPPVHPSRFKIKGSKKGSVDDEASILSSGTQGSQRSAASLSKSKSFKNALRGMFSRKDTKGSKKNGKIDPDRILETMTSNSYVTGPKDDVSASICADEERCRDQIETFVAEAVVHLNKAAIFMNDDATEVEIFVSKAFAYANEAEKVATTLASATSFKDRTSDLDALRSVASVSTFASTTSFIQRLDREEQLRRLEGVSFMDFGHAGCQSILCNGGGTIPFQQIKSLAFETMQILETLGNNVQFSPEVALSIRSATSTSVKEKWENYGYKGITTKVCGGKSNLEVVNNRTGVFQHMDKLSDRPAVRQGSILRSAKARRLEDRSDVDTSEMSSVVSEDDSSFMAIWSRKKGMDSNKNRTRFRVDNYSNAGSTRTSQASGHLEDDETRSYGSYTAVSSVRDSVASPGYTMSVTSATTTSTVKDMLDILCDRLCGGPTELAREADSDIHFEEYVNAHRGMAK